MTAGYLVEAARAADAAALPVIERAAAQLLAPYGVPPDALDETTPVDELAAAQAAGRLWVARDAGQRPVGFALVELVDGLPHLEEIDVHPDHGRRGIGRALVEAVLAWSRVAGYAAATLTTFRDVPWNAPFYATLGFRPLAADELTPELAAILADEAARGFDARRRIAMRRDFLP